MSSTAHPLPSPTAFAAPRLGVLRLGVALLAALTLAVLLPAPAARAAVLPDDRADLFWSKYSGGGMDIGGGAVAVTKKVTEDFGVDFQYFVDKVSGASIDVLSQASTIKDQRNQTSVDFTYIHGKTTYVLGFSYSKERDYISQTPHFSLSQDMFGDLTTITLGYSHSNNKVGENDGTASNPQVVWLGYNTSVGYTVGLTQILTRNLIAAFNFETITDNGYLQNPYRSIRYLDSANSKGYALGAQIYPDTRTSTALEARLKYYLPYRAAIGFSYRYFRDTWGIVANTEEITYTQPFHNVWTFEGDFRYYHQNEATFYSDLFSGPNVQNFEARDQNLAASQNITIGGKATYAFLQDGWKMFKRGTVTVDISHMEIKYTDFRNIKYYGLPQYPPGTEPLYNFGAMIYQVFLSTYF